MSAAATASSAAATAAPASGAAATTPAAAVAAPAAAAAAAAIAPQTIVLKVGSSSVSDGATGHLRLSGLTKLVETIVGLLQGTGGGAGGVKHRVILVTSGAVSVGCQRMRYKERPTTLVTKQAVAAIGQGRLMRVYDDLFSHFEQPIAQVLLSRENLGKRHHYLNALNTFTELMRLGALAVVNENDTVAVEELRFGDNDTLSALVASLVSADWLVILTDIDAVYTANPATHPTAKPIRCVANVHEWVSGSPDAKGSSGDGAGADGKAAPEQSGKWGTGGMATKIQAARIATSAGVRTVIMSSARVAEIGPMIHHYTPLTAVPTVPATAATAATPATAAAASTPATVVAPTDAKTAASAPSTAALPAAVQAFPYGTLFLPLPAKKTVRGQKRWIAHGLPVTGKIWVDGGAVSAIADKTSLFAAGVRGVEGDFAPHSNIAVYSQPRKPPTAADAAAAIAGGAGNATGSGSGGSGGSGGDADGGLHVEPGVELARGLSNYSSAEIRVVMGHASKEFERLLGYMGADSIIHRDALVLTHPMLVARANNAAAHAKHKAAAAGAAGAATAPAATGKAKAAAK